MTSEKRCEINGWVIVAQRPTGRMEPSQTLLGARDPIGTVYVLSKNGEERRFKGYELAKRFASGSLAPEQLFDEDGITYMLPGWAAPNQLAIEGEVIAKEAWDYFEAMKRWAEKATGVPVQTDDEAQLRRFIEAILAKIPISDSRP